MSGRPSQLKHRQESDCPKSRFGSGTKIQTPEPNHPHRHKMLSTLPDRLSGARQIDQAAMVHLGDIARDKAAAVLLIGKEYDDELWMELFV
jgi:hypothetical protein